MKKLLLTSTALLGFAGAAAAEVTITGSAEMGIVGGDGIETQFWQDVDVTFTLSGESDSGISFGASVDLDEADFVPATGTNALDNQFDDNGYAVFIKGAFGTLTLGDTDGAIDWAIQDADLGNPGSIADNETSHVGFNGDFLDGVFDGQILRYDYTAGNFGVAISYEQGATGTGGVLLPGDTGDTAQIGLKYALDLGGTTVNLGLGYGQADTGLGLSVEMWALSADASFAGGFKAVAELTHADGGILGEVDHIGIGVGYESGPFSVGANYGEFDFSTGGDVSGWGLAAAYDFGGGLSAHFGYGSSDFGGGAPGVDSWSLGMAMSF